VFTALARMLRYRQPWPRTLNKRNGRQAAAIRFWETLHPCKGSRAETVAAAERTLRPARAGINLPVPGTSHDNGDRLNCCPKIPDLSCVIAAKPTASAAVDPAGLEAHARGLMVPDTWVYRAADRLIRQHGADALEEVNWLICDALDRRDRDRARLWVRIRLAILVLQAPPQGPLH
jgi:hypothetical protein